MGQARETMDALTQAILKADFDTFRSLFAPDAVTVTPDAGELVGADAAADYMRTFAEGFPDADYEYLHTYEVGDTAIDEGYFCGTNTQPLRMPDGQRLDATGLRVRLRACDLLTVNAEGKIVSHRLYFNESDLAQQLGLSL